jgi:hypothetical protein
MFRHWPLPFSVICFALLLAVIVMWVRSYIWFDLYSYRNGHPGFTNIVSCRCALVIEVWESSESSMTAIPKNPVRLSHRMPDAEQESFDRQHKAYPGVPGFQVSVFPIWVRYSISYWLMALILALLCWLPWYRRPFNFSLRDFVVSFTILAVLLGFIGWLVE